MKNKQVLSTAGDIIAGIAGGLSFIAFYMVLDIKVLWSVLLGMAVYITGRKIFSKPTSNSTEKGGAVITDQDIKQILMMGREKLKLLKRLKYKVNQEEIKGKISKICQVVEKIFEDFKKDPKDIRTARSFLNYYLDASIKIIQHYVELTAHRYQSADLQDILLRVEGMLDKIHRGFEEQLAKLMENDVMDLDAEMEVLERAMQVEFLKEPHSLKRAGK